MRVVFVDLAPQETLASLGAVYDALKSQFDELATEPHSAAEHMFVSEKAQQIARLLGPSPKRRAFEALILPKSPVLLSAEQLLQSTSPHAQQEQAPTPSLQENTVAALQARVTVLCGQPLNPLTAKELTDLLCSPLMHDPALRSAGCAALVRYDSGVMGEALSTLALLLQHTHGRLGHHEALAFGALYAQGLTRWPHRSPFAIEIADPREEWTRELHRIATQLGSYEQLFDERGYTLHRIVASTAPSLRVTHGETAHPLQQLLEALHEWTDVQLWVAGVRLPGDLPWSQWCAILGQ